MESIQQILTSFKSVTLADLDSVSLMNRQDTKYVFSVKKLPAVLQKLSMYYAILEIDNLRLMSYSNIYFDTDDFMFYTKHHNGHLNRHKIRNRQYDDSNIAFCEVKFKSNKSRTEKKRKGISELFEEFDDVAKAFLAKLSPIESEQLSAKLFMHFDRITLVHKNWKDRCTIDLNLKANTKERAFEYKNVVIAEIKQEKFSPQSDFNQVLKSEKIYPMGFSKYCISMAKVYPELKQNNFKIKITHLNKIINE